MHAPRRLAVLLAAGLLALAHATPALALDASDARDGHQTAQSEAGARTGTAPPLTDNPRRSGEGGSRSQRSGSRKSPGASRTTATQLPYTGADARLIGFLGLALVLFGIGLRLRTADVRR